MKLLVYTDGTDRSRRALRLAAEWHRRLGAELAVITVRPGTSAIETPPALGVDYPLDGTLGLPPGLGILVDAARHLAEAGHIDGSQPISFRELPQGNLFVCRTPGGERVPFYEFFGDFVESINQEIDRHRHDLLIVAPPRRSRPVRWFFGDTARKLALELHASVLLVRGGRPDSRVVVCSDGSPAARRQFPMLKELLPAIGGDIDLLYVDAGREDDDGRQAARECLQQASRWLESCGKKAAVVTRTHTDRESAILEAAGSDALLCMGASLRHDVYRRTLGSLPMRILAKTEASVLLVKAPPETDAELFKTPFHCSS
jgi:nucleotide-binding universal stress UspA family protein